MKDGGEGYGLPGPEVNLTKQTEGGRDYIITAQDSYIIGHKLISHLNYQCQTDHTLIHINF